MAAPDTQAPDLTAAGYPLDVDSYRIERQIGRGAFASVYGAVCLTNNEQVAIKVIDLEASDDDDGGGVDWDELRKEAAVMHSMHHENVVGCLASFVHKSELWLVMPLLSGGSCADIMKHTAIFNEGFRDEHVLATILRDVLQGIEYCHDDGRVHRDVKAGNILLGDDGIAKLSDFGVSGAIIEGGLKMKGRNTFTGSLLWMAPEVMQQERGHNQKADIWSVGVTALELAFGKPPHSDERPVKIMLTIMQNPPPTCDSYNTTHNFSRKFQNFCKTCLVKDPTKRPSASALLKHNFITSFAKDNNYIIENVLRLRSDVEVPKDLKLPRSISVKLIQENTDDQHTEHSQSQGWDFSDRMSGNVKNKLEAALNDDTPDTAPTDGGDDQTSEPVRKGRFMVETDD